MTFDTFNTTLNIFMATYQSKDGPNVMTKAGREMTKFLDLSLDMWDNKTSSRRNEENDSLSTISQRIKGYQSEYSKQLWKNYMSLLAAWCNWYQETYLKKPILRKVILTIKN